MQIVESFLTKNPCYTCGRTIDPKGFMLHSVGCSQPSADVFIKNWNSESYDRACVHGFIDANTGVIKQTLPWNRRGWHAGGSANNTHIGVEMCEPAEIKYTGGSSFAITNKEKAVAAAERTYQSAVQLVAFLCKKYGWNPKADGVIISHKEGCARGVASNHGDPEHLWKGLALSYTMDTFRDDVQKAMGSQEEKKDETKENTLYRVQIGAYSKKENAENQLKVIKAKGYDAFITKVGDLYKVQVGAFSVKANAENMLAKVKKDGFEAFITTKSGTQVSVSETPKKSIEEIAKEVINGKWGNGEERKKKLEAAGYSYSEVQKKVNELCK